MKLVVINCAGENILNPFKRWNAQFKHDVWNSRIKTSSALVQAVTEAPGVESLINIVGVSHYKPNDSQIYDESSRVEKFDYMSSLCMDWERATNLPVSRNCRTVSFV